MSMINALAEAAEHAAPAVPAWLVGAGALALLLLLMLALLMFGKGREHV